MGTPFSYLRSVDPAVLEALYRDYQRDPEAVDPSWRHFFAGFEFATSRGPITTTAPAPTKAGAVTPGPAGLTDFARKELAALRLIDGYRLRGHLFTKTNPVRKRRQYRPTLDLENFGLSAADLDTVFPAGAEVGLGPAPLRAIVGLLEQTYCQSIGVEYKYVDDINIVHWLQERMERTRNTPHYSTAQQQTIARQLCRAVQFEKFLHTKFVGQKRFSLEGGEAILPALEALLLTASQFGVEECVVGMAHRGRLNVLANLFGKPVETIFAEFKGEGPEPTPNALFEGDVKYHLGYTNQRILANGRPMRLVLSPNPSHLEAVNPVVEGIARARIERVFAGESSRVVPVLIHGDASIAAQGVVYEVVQMSQLKGYRTGGTVHIVINNQLGFTTNYIDGRSSIYCTDVGKVTRSPIFHVNGDDIEAVVAAVELATEFRQRFHRDVFIDLLCYRRHGHNEADEPRFTQPILYKIIEQHPNPFDYYARRLAETNALPAETTQQLATEVWQELSARFEAAKVAPAPTPGPRALTGVWEGLRFATEADFVRSPETGVPEATLRDLGERAFTIPAEIQCFPKIRRLFDERRQMLAAGTALDWSAGEWLAYASLLAEGRWVRISGQDVERGTFAHRHAVVTIEDSVEVYIPLQHLPGTESRFRIYNSLLSEYAVLGFDLGYASTDPHSLVVWEAQFGDFANGAQIIIDQFLSCAESKWQRMSGLVLLLPHGYEGQGPEHSSARLERYLELCANYNMQVVNCSTPANLFHALRRQLHRPFRKPLIVMTPKSLLRHPRCVSPLADFTHGGFREVIDDDTIEDPSAVQRVLLCAGKLYYELAERRAAEARRDIAIVRLEQLYPLPAAQLQTLIDRYAGAEWVWVQEEPQNMGAWPHLLRKWPGMPSAQPANMLRAVTRKENCTPATGYHRHHVTQQQELLQQAFTVPARPTQAKRRTAAR